MPLDIQINTRSNTLEVADGRAIVTEFEYDPGETVAFKYSTKTFETMTCTTQIGTLEPQIINGKNGKIDHATSATVELYNLTLSGTVKSGSQPSNVAFTLKKKGSGSGLKNPKKPLPTE
jgi:hypothetical protein